MIRPRPQSKPDRERGMVTVEIALGSIAVAVFAYFLIGVCGLLFTQMKCANAATDIARQAARNDQAAIVQLTDKLPSTATVARRDEGAQVHVRVDWTLRPWGDWFGPVTVSADAETRREGS
ncbi:MAG: DUF4244 domain-containing protein [Propionibacteriaceae bacterium]|jgi:hypothetical protein|nr:DUF4244 domain-containing protein [Propionibacteriaceae bacterium]